ncbi:hypothetical protein OUZ56_030961 [Daphnia magna]|uniref:Uncharacterized protein n=1 Tax=Daphnia magna TaxID=35525 RepID=A0ABQ9ZST7_9CRUS|nr:hypothetical protein OUZ56_030961 [Daphnia magna]
MCWKFKCLASCLGLTEKCKERRRALYKSRSHVRYTRAYSTDREVCNRKRKKEEEDDQESCLLPTSVKSIDHFCPSDWNSTDIIFFYLSPFL